MTAALALIETELRDFIPRALDGVSAKSLAKQLSATERAARNWKQSQNLPGGAYLIMLGRLRPEIRRKLTELMHAEMGETDKHPDEVLTEIQRIIDRSRGT